MALLKRIHVKFGGSFQCRLATDFASKGASPRDASEIEPGRPDAGWTFAFAEQPLDRIIRLANPVSLRNALMEGFTPTRVTSIEVQHHPLFGVGFEPPFLSVPSDPLLGAVVSLGANPMFDTAAGGGAVTLEAILNMQFSIGGNLFAAVPVSLPKLVGARAPDPAFQTPNGSDSRWIAEYMLRKPQLVAPLSQQMDVRRWNLLTVLSPSAGTPYIPRYASFFGYRCPTATFPLKDVNFILNQPGTLGSLLLGWTWSLELSFFRFDGDTLVGQMDGLLSGLHSNV
jgi:hypothetical protein